jgi:hypothetical protein
MISNVPSVYEHSAAKRGKQHLRIARTLGRIDTLIGGLDSSFLIATAKPMQRSHAEQMRFVVDILEVPGQAQTGLDLVVIAIR